MPESGPVDVARRGVERGQQLALSARDRIPTRRRPQVDLAGYTLPELRAFVEATARNARVVPPRRLGHAAVRSINALADHLPAEAVLLGRAIADAAPPIGGDVGSALGDILETYLPGTIDAWGTSAGGGPAGQRAERLLVEQLRMLHEVTAQVVQAQADHDDLDLRIHADFLREKFGRLQRSPLDLDPAAPDPTPNAAPRPTERVTPAAPTALTSPTLRGRHHLHVDRDPVTLFAPQPKGGGHLGIRLALPRGVGVVLGVVSEKRSGAAVFASTRVRGWGSGKRRMGGFNAAQIDLRLGLDLTDVRRFVVHATTAERAREPLDVVLFLTESEQGSVSLPTAFARRRGLATTVIASGWETTDGLFVRNESSFHPHLRAAATAYGFGQVTWLSDDTPAI
jgi:hypothetical protein